MAKAYASVPQFSIFGMRREAWTDIGAGALVEDAQINEILEAVSRLADSHFIGRGYPVPIENPPPELIRAVCKIAAWDVLLLRGADPSQLGNAGPADEAKKAEEWLRAVARGEVNLTGVTIAGDPAPRPRAATNIATVISDGDCEERYPRHW